MKLFERKNNEQNFPPPLLTSKLENNFLLRMTNSDNYISTIK